MPITLEFWLAYVATVLVLMVAPGPSHLLMLANSIGHGFRRATLTAAGDLSANVLQMLAAGLGLAAALAASAEAFLVVKWAGVAYLVWLGVRMIRRANLLSDAGANPAPAAVGGAGLFAQGFVTSAANPKAVVFFAALFPQFLRADEPLAPQLLVLGATYVAIDAAFLSAYGGFAATLGRLWRERAARLLPRLAGGLLIGAAVLLGLKDIERPG